MQQKNNQNTCKKLLPEAGAGAIMSLRSASAEWFRKEKEKPVNNEDLLKQAVEKVSSELVRLRTTNTLLQERIKYLNEVNHELQEANYSLLEKLHEKDVTND